MNSFRLHYLLIIGMVVWIACTINEPSLPKWFVEWKLPIPQADFVMEEATDDSNIVLDTTATGSQFLEISVSDSLERQTVSPEDMAVMGEVDSTGDHIDNIDLGNLGPISTAPYWTRDILGTTLTVGATINVPGGNVTLPDQDLQFPSYIWAHCKSGQMTVELVNNTFLNLDSGARIVITDAVNNTRLGVADFPDPINAYNSGFASPPIDLTNKTFVNQFRLQIRLPIKPEAQHLVTEQDTASSVWVVARMNDLIVFEAECYLPPQSIVIHDSSSLLEERHHIYRAEIDQGHVNVEIRNQLEVPANVLITMPNISNMITGEIFSKTYFLPPQSNQVETILLDGMEIEDYPDPNSGRIIDYLQYDIDVLTDSLPELVRISESDSVHVTVIPDSIYFVDVEGILDSIDVPIDPVEKKDLFDVSKIQGTIFLDSLSLRLNLYNETNVPIHVTLNISGKNSSQSVNLAPVQLTLPRNRDGGEFHLVLSGNDPHPNIVDLMGILPTDIRIDADAYVQGEGQIRIDQSVWGDYEISSPLYLRLMDPLVVKSDPDSIRLDEDVRKNIEERVQTAMAVLDEYNGLPLAARASIYVSADSSNLFSDVIQDSSSKFIIDDIVLDAGTIGTDGYVQKGSTERVQISLTNKQLQLLTIDTLLFIGSRLTIDETNTLVKFKPSDEIRVNGFFQIKFLMGEDDKK